MSTLDYIEVTAKVTPPEPWSDLLIDLLGEIGFESFEEKQQGFKAYIPVQKFDKNKLDDIRLPEDNASHVEFNFEINHINSKNWNELWESNFEPVDIEGRCLIRAPFHQAKTGYEYEIVIEPKMSFGTGHHETTFLMVQWVLDTDFTGKDVLDMGCGTGILAILANKKGAGYVLAIDNFIYAYENALENAQYNNASAIKVEHGDASLLGNKQFDIILANITRNVLLEDMRIYSSVLKPEGNIIISGFFAADEDELVIEAEKHGLIYLASKQYKDWIAIKFIKK